MLSRLCLAAAAILVSWGAWADVDEMPFGGRPVVYGHEPKVDHAASREETRPADEVGGPLADPVERWSDESGPRAGRRGLGVRAGGGRGGNGRGGPGR